MNPGLRLIVLLFCVGALAQDDAPKPAGQGRIQFENTDYKAVQGETRKIKVIRTTRHQGTVAFILETVAGSATAGKDFEPISETLTFDDGITEKTVGVVIHTDLIPELPEGLRLVLSNPSGGVTLGDQCAHARGHDRQRCRGAGAADVGNGGSWGLVTHLLFLPAGILLLYDQLSLASGGNMTNEPLHPIRGDHQLLPKQEGTRSRGLSLTRLTLGCQIEP